MSFDHIPTLWDVLDDMGGIRAGLRERWKSFAVATRNLLFLNERIVRVTRASASWRTINRPEVPYYKNPLEEPVGCNVVRRQERSERRCYRGRLMGESPRQDPQLGMPTNSAVWREGQPMMRPAIS
ncbi:hypothetical protein A2Z00_01810 [Candidatus Gottesmanbacteria bacterium RBG_13_45_10]|uniref:Uncharacterized protein n=1 Tax=Candidatus Gottesmanbacteria bacterium RBG_13_45_10 TaxID=1798370 RepID=A0A1F5ZGZ4_9BACT|nr:MAG: hypothetical protein A2Z00_01810 [Candidatus Gottesmanbacteria bacterium RBG_13_45_10]